MVASSHGEVALTTIGRREAVLAHAFALEKNVSLATHHLGRACRIIGTIGTALHRRALDDLVATLAPLGVALEHSETTAIDSIDNAGFIVECSAHPEVLAKEVLSQLRGCETVHSAVISRSSQDKSDAALRLSAEVDATRPADIEISLGSLRGDFYTLKVWLGVPVASNRSRVITRIADAAVAERESQRIALERSMVSPVAVPCATLDGVFNAPEMRAVVRMIEQVASTPIPVLLLGETGTGKEVLARALHDRSSRSAGPFIPFNCGTMPSDMFDAQLFGHVKGAFTGSVGESLGVIRAADRGTLFLDEIADLPLTAQPKLLRFLESGEVHPVGAVRPVSVNVRVVAATNANLTQMLLDGRFREDLYFRINGVTVVTPPLRKRREDIPALARLFLGRFASGMGRPTPVLSDGAMELLLSHPWPGNIRQLSNEMRRLVALSPPGEPIRGEQIEFEAAAAATGLPRHTADNVHHRTGSAPGLTLDEAVQHLERDMISNALKDSRGSISEAAERLGVSRKGLFLKRRRLGIA